jgi:hypothetical protein
MQMMNIIRLLGYTRMEYEALPDNDLCSILMEQDREQFMRR